MNEAENTNFQTRDNDRLKKSKQMEEQVDRTVEAILG